MRWCYPVVVAAFVCGVIVAAPVPPRVDGRKLVDGLGDPSEAVRDQALIALRDRADALPWLRRAARSADRDTARRAALLLAASEGKRQALVSKAVESCIRDGRADLFVEWHHYWQPKSKDDLWPVGPRMGKAALDQAAKLPRDGGDVSYLEHWIAVYASGVKPAQYFDGTLPFRLDEGRWHVRTDRIAAFSGETRFGFASVADSVYVHGFAGGYLSALGTVHVSRLNAACVLCDGSVLGMPDRSGDMGLSRVSTQNSFVACRGTFVGTSVRGSLILVDGDVDLTWAHDFRDSIIRATGEIRLRKDQQIGNCKIEANVKNATAPYKFFELADVGISLADDEEGLVVTAVKAGTPFGDCGLAKGDLIRTIDDAPAGHSEEFRKKVRRALVRQGDCLLTVARGDKTLDLPVFFPLPK